MFTSLALFMQWIKQFIKKYQIIQEHFKFSSLKSISHSLHEHEKV